MHAYIHTYNTCTHAYIHTYIQTDNTGFLGDKNAQRNSRRKDAVETLVKE